MALSLKESHAVNDLSQLVYDFLPGSGSVSWKGHVSFRSVAEKVGVGAYWQQVSKGPMLVGLFTRTFENRRQAFEPLILEIVRAGIGYCQKNGRPLQPEQIDQLNGILLQLGFKFPDLWEADFKESLRLDSGTRAKHRVDRALREEQISIAANVDRLQQLQLLEQRFLQIHDMANRQAAGIELEHLLNRLFALHDLTPRKSFCVLGEQIDGSFELDSEIYLVEAKWEKAPLSEKELLVFRGKIEGKSAYTRGVFISVNGITEEAKFAICRGKQPTFFVLDGYDLMMVLKDNIDLKYFLRQRQRILAEEGLVAVPFNQVL